MTCKLPIEYHKKCHQCSLCEELCKLRIFEDFVTLLNITVTVHVERNRIIIDRKHKSHCKLIHLVHFRYQCGFSWEGYYIP